jgi:hypothetical protein
MFGTHIAFCVTSHNDFFWMSRDSTAPLTSQFLRFFYQIGYSCVEEVALGFRDFPLPPKPLLRACLIVNTIAISSAFRSRHCDDKLDVTRVASGRMGETTENLVRFLCPNFRASPQGETWKVFKEPWVEKWCWPFSWREPACFLSSREWEASKNYFGRSCLPCSIFLSLSHSWLYDTPVCIFFCFLRS